jgi:hypothetical protein
MKWLDRTLMTSPYYYGLCLSEKDFRKELKRLDVPKDGWPRFLASDHANATAHFFESSNGALSVIVTLGGTKGKSIAQIHALLVHEAVHIWQAIRENIGEKSPSSEFEAYSIQSISQGLMQAFKDAKKGKK